MRLLFSVRVLLIDFQSSPSEPYSDVLDTIKDASDKHMFFVKNAGLARFGLFASRKLNHESTVSVDVKPAVPTVGHSLNQVFLVFFLLTISFDMLAGANGVACCIAVCCTVCRVF